MRTLPRHPTIAVAVLALAVPLAACGSDDDGGDAPLPAITGAPRETTADATEGPPVATSPGSTPDAAPATQDATSALAAVELAEAEAGGTAFALDREDEGWQVSVAVGSEEVDVDVDPSGTEILGTEPDDDLDDDERTALDAATTRLADAVRSALAETGGTLEDAELTEEDGTVAWEVGLADGVEVYVEAGTGAVLRVDRD